MSSAGETTPDEVPAHDTLDSHLHGECDPAGKETAQLLPARPAAPDQTSQTSMHRGEWSSLQSRSGCIFFGGGGGGRVNCDATFSASVADFFYSLGILSVLRLLVESVLDVSAITLDDCFNI